MWNTKQSRSLVLRSFDSQEAEGEACFDLVHTELCTTTTTFFDVVVVVLTRLQRTLQRITALSIEECDGVRERTRARAWRRSSLINTE